MTLINLIILFLAGISYLIGFWAIFKKGYRPNLFTRIVFLLLSLNNLVSVIKLNNQSATLTLAWVTFFGSLLIFFGSIIFKGEHLWGRNEIISIILLVISFLFWIFTDIPLINLSIGLIAHLLGSLPTVVRVIKKPESENIPFWLLFAIASIITLLSTHSGNIKDYLFAVYFCIFDSALTILAFRKYFNKKVLIIKN